jgi:hypothetical protein
MTDEDIEVARGIIEQYDALVERAIEILETPPFNTYVTESEHARLKFHEFNHGGKIEYRAWLFWPEVRSGYYDSCDIENRSKQVPMDVLLMEPEEFDAWETEQRRVAEEAASVAEQSRREADAIKQVAHERAVYAALKQKFEGGQS